MNVTIEGAKIYFTIPVLGGIPITETIVNGAIVTFVLFLLCLFLTHDLKVRPTSKRQIIAEYIVNLAKNFVQGNMGEKFAYFTPFVAALFAASVFSSLLSVIGMYPPTSDLSTTLAWAVLVFVLITYHKIKAGGLGGYLLGFAKPIAVLTPFNVLSEVATPISMAFRHFGNIVSGSVITALVYAALALASSALFGLIPGAVGSFLSNIPLLQFGIPAVLSIYFDWFSSFMQAFIFCMLTTLYIANAAEE
jgi:F-type H+-transporting ATPase subunit a